MKRLNSIDIFRGISLFWMFLGHLLNWWLIDQDSWLYHFIFNMLDPIGSSAFIFIAGISTVIALRARFSKAELTENYTKKIIRREYFFRALLILLIALIYNVSIAIALFNPLYIWTWFVLLTIAISLLIAWPLYKISIYFRIIIGIVSIFYIWNCYR